MNIQRICFAILAATAASNSAPNFNLPLDRPYTLRNAEPSLLDAEMARQIRSEGPMSFIFPRPCFSEVDSSRVCGQTHGFAYADGSRNRSLSISPLIGYEYRRTGENVSDVDGGLVATGGSGPVSFYLDARMFTELHEDPDHISYDREFVERQDEKASGTVVYSSYSRYRSNLSLDLPWARLAAGRDAVHWGPGLFANLSFNQNALPFNQVSWQSTVGPLTVISLYGQLAIHSDSLGDFNTNPDTRSLYAHRYEWRATRNLAFGISEQLVVYNWEEPFAFIPVIPLFILKGTGFERRNNGNISGDFAYRMPGLGMVYSEFLIDDLQSPTSLFDDFWGNKWAWMAGLHLVRETPWGQAGAVMEYSRVEPWVYTHYKPGTVQTAHGGHPLGNPQGPNSQWVVMKPYFRSTGGWYASARMDLLWKGKDAGSALEDTGASGKGPKTFIQGVGRPDIDITPCAGFAWRSTWVEGAFTAGRQTRLLARIHWRY
jgi:hypothetical protein